jgi:hypothetical protein
MIRVEWVIIIFVKNGLSGLLGLGEKNAKSDLAESFEPGRI